MLDKIREIVFKYTENADVEISEDTVFMTDLRLDSYELVLVLSDVEKAFGVEISDRDIAGMKTVRDVMDYISARKS